MSGVTDCYQPAERHFRITRSCLEVLAEFRNPVSIITKNFLVTRDLDVLKELAAFDAVHVFISITTLNADLAAKMEPRASRPAHRLRAIEMLAKAGVPVGVMVAPIMPGPERPRNSRRARGRAQGRARSSAGYTHAAAALRREGRFHRMAEGDIFPEKLDRILGTVRDVRGGKLNVSDFGTRMRGEGPYAEQIGADVPRFSRAARLRPNARVAHGTFPPPGRHADDAGGVTEFRRSCGRRLLRKTVFCRGHFLPSKCVRFLSPGRKAYRGYARAKKFLDRGADFVELVARQLRINRQAEHFAREAVGPGQILRRVAEGGEAGLLVQREGIVNLPADAARGEVRAQRVARPGAAARAAYTGSRSRRAGQRGGQDEPRLNPVRRRTSASSPRMATRTPGSAASRAV